MAKKSKKSLEVSSADVGTLSSSLRSKSYVHSLPTQLLIRAHNRIELQHLEDPKNRKLQIAHTNLFLEMELREVEHFDTDPDFFTPSYTDWPFDLEYDATERQRLFNKKEIKRIRLQRSSKQTKTSRLRISKQTKTSKQTKKNQKYIRQQITKNQDDELKVTKIIKKVIKSVKNIKKDFPTKRTSTSKPIKDLKFSSRVGIREPYVEDDTNRIFTNKAVAAWKIQPTSGNIPIANGPRPKKEHWYKTIWPPLGAYQTFMQKTLSAFYRKKAPPWAIQEWDIELTVTNTGGSDTLEKRNFIQTKIDPN